MFPGLVIRLVQTLQDGGSPNKDAPWRRGKILLEALNWHLPAIPFHTGLQKVRG
jgi:hypothetical protein